MNARSKRPSAPRPVSTSAAVALVAVASIGLSGPVTAQQTEMSAQGPAPVAFLHGQIVDSISGQPIPGVLVRMDSGQEAFTDRRGEFEFADLPEGKRLLAMMTADCRVTWGQVTVVQRFPRDVTFRLPPVFGAKAEQDQREVEERQRSTGRRLEAHEIEGMNAKDVMELVRRLAPNMVSPMAGDVGATSSFRSARGRSTGVADPPVVLIDGVRTPGAEGTLSTMRPQEVESIEVQPGAAAGWEYGSAGASGVIKITLKKGLATGAEERPEAAPCSVPGFPGR